jgi:hypothetical protein
MERCRAKQETSLQERLANHGRRLRDEAKRLPPGGEREGLIRRARQTEIASHITEWLTSPGLASPKVTDYRRDKVEAREETKMGGYYAYLIGDDGRITNRVAFFATTDEEAKERAKRLVDCHAIELWQEARKVATFDPEQYGSTSTARARPRQPPNFHCASAARQE